MKALICGPVAVLMGAVLMDEAYRGRTAWRAISAWFGLGLGFLNYWAATTTSFPLDVTNFINSIIP